MTIEQLKKIKVGDIVAWNYMEDNNMAGIVTSVSVRSNTPYNTPYARVQCYDGSETTIGKLGFRSWTILTK